MKNIIDNDLFVLVQENILIFKTVKNVYADISVCIAYWYTLAKKSNKSFISSKQ